MRHSGGEHRKRRADRWRRAIGSRLFLPTDVPEVAAGRFWIPRSATGYGTAGFSQPDGNGSAPWALVQATSAAQPSRQTAANGAVFHRFAANTTILGSAGTLQAGWTGGTGVLMWIAAPGGVTGLGSYFAHFNATGNQRRISFSPVNVPATPDLQAMTVTSDGATQANTSTRWADQITPAFVFCAMYFDPLFVRGGSTPQERCKLYVNGVIQPRLLEGIAIGTSLFNATAEILLATRLGYVANVDALDIGPTYYTNGVLSLEAERAVACYDAPVTSAQVPFLRG